MPIPLLGLLGVGGIGAATNAVSSVAGNIPLIGPLVSCVAKGIGDVSSGLLPGLFK